MFPTRQDSKSWGCMDPRGVHGPPQDYNNAGVWESGEKKSNKKNPPSRLGEIAIKQAWPWASVVIQSDATNKLNHNLPPPSQANGLFTAGAPQCKWECSCHF